MLALHSQFANGIHAVDCAVCGGSARSGGCDKSDPGHHIQVTSIRERHKAVVLLQVAQRLHGIREGRPLAPRLVQRRIIARADLDAKLLRDVRLRVNTCDMTYCGSCVCSVLQSLMRIILAWPA